MYLLRTINLQKVHFSSLGIWAITVLHLTYCKTVINSAMCYYYFCFKMSFVLSDWKNKTLLFHSYPHIYHFLCSSFLCVDLDFHLISFSTAWMASFNSSCSVDLLIMNYFSFHISKKVIISCLFLKHIFSWCRILGLKILSLSGLLRWSFGLHFYWEVSCNLPIYYDYFSDFLFYYGFEQLDFDMSLYNFIQVSWSSLGFFDLCFYGFHRFRKCSAFIFKNIFLSLSLIPFRNSSYS